ncbi:MAG: DNA methyltransferase [Phormidium sp.]
MDESDLQRVQEFLKRWQGSSGDERANKDSFFLDLCKALGVEPPPAKGSIPGDRYCFEKDVKIPHPSGKVTTCFVDFYKQGHFVIEAKQGGEVAGKGTAKRGTATYFKEMEKAFVQGLSYTRHLEPQPPFLITCDIGSHFEIWLGFSGDYGGYGARRTIPLADFQKPDIFALFVDIFTNPQKRNPEKIAARVTREVAADLAALARSLESNRQPQEVASFLMGCIFTMFAEDVGLLPEKLFTEALKERWIPKPKSFQPEVEALWQAMNEGTSFGFSGKLLKFNGGLFADASAFPLNGEQLEVLLQASQRDWSQVEPAIFGTLLERALDAKERSKLGAHYTPRSYVERLVRPVILEPIREQWELVQAEVKQTLENAGEEPTKKQVKNAIALIQDFLKELREIKILDPACGSGNFLYVTLDLLKGLESEVLRRLADITGGEQLSLDFDQVNPSQFLGIELNPRAAAIADLVIWIGYLQWHFKRFGNIPPIEPVLRAYNNIECRDAVLDYDSKEIAIDPTTKQPRTRWGGRMMTHSVTGENVPDPTNQIPIYKFINPRPAEWQEANYIVSNPPFIGNARMREVLGDGYAETLRQVYQDVPDTVDFVMYWWHKAAELVRLGKVARFGFITTNSIRQVWQRKVIDFHLSQKNPIRLIFAISDHPWVDGGAAVRIAMTAAELDNNQIKIAQLGVVISEKEEEIPENSAEQVEVQLHNVGKIFSSLQVGADLTQCQALNANNRLSSRGVMLFGSGFIVEQSDWAKVESEVLFPYINGRDFMQRSRNVRVIDLFGLTIEQAEKNYPKAYQWVLERVKPERDANRDKSLRENWWIFGRIRTELRRALKGLKLYIATVETSKHRIFTFLDAQVLADNMLIAIALEDAYFLGVLSSKVHVKWALAAGGDLGGNTPRYNKTRCFDPFPFPDSTPEQKQKIRELGEKLDNHRKKVQSQHPEITLTGMYNLLEKLRAGEPFTEADKTYNNKALVSTLKQIHDSLDAAVLEAYGWEQNISDEEILERLVALNAERSAEEHNGLIRWLRPEYQAPKEIATQMTLAGITEAEEVITAPAEQKTWPKKPKEQLAAIRDLLRTTGGEWTVEQVVAKFKGATRQKKAISEHLETLEALGILLSRQENSTICWHHK